MLKICFFVNVMLMLSVAATAQTQKDSANKKITFPNFLPTTFSGKEFIKPLPSNYYYNHIGFFCKEELQIQKATKLPLKIRVGTLNECDKMEGKSF